MGYRSDLTICIDEPHVLKATFDNHKGFKSLLRLAENEPEHVKVEGKTPNHIIYQIYEVKWYDSYEEVSDITEFLDSLPANGFGGYRIGEDDGDIETIGSPWEYEMSVERTVVFN